MAIRNLQTEQPYEDGLSYGDLVDIVNDGDRRPSAQASEPSPWESLAQQISQQWQGYGINKDVKGINRANELAQLLANYGITDISKLGIKETPYEEQVNVSGGGEGVADVWETVKRNRGQLTYGDKTFGRLGGFGSGGEKEFSAPQEYLQQSDPGRYGLGYSAAGKGWTEYEVVTGKDGKPVIVPRWGSSSDLDPELIQFLAMAALPFTGGLSASLGTALGSKVAGQIAAQALISGSLGGLSAASQGESFGSGFGKGAITGGLTAGVGQIAAPYINTLASGASDLIGGGKFGDIVSGAVQGAGRGAVGAVITGDSVLDAILTGAAGGATSAGTDMLVKGTNSTLGQYLKDVPGPIKNAVLSAATAGILGKDIDKAVINSFMRELQGQIKTASKTATSGQAASAGYGGAETEGFFDPEAEDADSYIRSLMNYEAALPQDMSTGGGDLPDWTLAPYKADDRPGSYYAGLENIIDEWDEADIIPDTYGTGSGGPADQSVEVTGTLPKTDVVIPDWDFMEVPDRTPGSPMDTTPKPPTPDDDRTSGLPPVSGGGKTAVTKAATKPGMSTEDLMRLLLAMQGQQPEQEEEYRLANIQPLGYELMYGLRG